MENSTWDSSSQTLILKGVDFTTTATTAMKLPAGTTVVLADGTENTITGGDAAAAKDGAYTNKIYIYGIYAEGALTIQGESLGTGKLSVNSGAHINSGDAWTYSTAVCGKGDLAVKGGIVTTNGGKASCADGGFSYGIQLSKGCNLFVTGGSLIAIGGESLNTEDPQDVKKSFSCGIYVYSADISVSGTGKLEATNVPAMDGGGLSFGVDMINGGLNVSDNAGLTATAGNAINISGGSIKLIGGKITAVCTGDSQNAIALTKDLWDDGNGNIEVAGGKLETSGGVYMHQSNPTGEQGLFSVTGGTVSANSIFGANRFTVSNGAVKSGYIHAKKVELQSGSLTVRETVRKNQYTGDVYASNAIRCGNLTVNSGMLDAAWDWGENTPVIFPADVYEGYPTPLVSITDGAAVFSGGTAILDTGCAGNTALKVGTVNLGNRIEGIGYTKEDGSDSYLQKDSDTPVKFTVAPISLINEVIISDAKFNYQPEDVPQKTAKVFLPDDWDKYEIAFESWEEMEDGAPAAYWYSDDSQYTSFMKRITQFEGGKTYMYSIELWVKDGYAFADNCPVMVNNNTMNAANVAKTKNVMYIMAVKTITLPYKDADYSKVDTAIAKANALNKDDYKDFSTVEAAINAVVRGKNITEQTEVDKMATAIEDAINALEKKPADAKPETSDKSPQTSDNSNLALWIALLFVSGGVLTGAAVLSKKKKHLIK